LFEQINRLLWLLRLLQFNDLFEQFSARTRKNSANLLSFHQAQHVKMSRKFINVFISVFIINNIWCICVQNFVKLEDLDSNFYQREIKPNSKMIFIIHGYSDSGNFLWRKAINKSFNKFVITIFHLCALIIFFTENCTKCIEIRKYERNCRKLGKWYGEYLFVTWLKSIILQRLSRFNHVVLAALHLSKLSAIVSFSFT